MCALKHDLRARLPIELDIPALAARRADIPLLVQHVMDRIATEHPDLVARFFTPEGAVRLHPKLVESLLGATLPLNVREIEALVWKAIAASPGDRLSLPVQAKTAAAASPKARLGADEIRAALAAHNGSVELAATELGLPNRFALYRLMKKYGLARAGRR